MVYKRLIKIPRIPFMIVMGIFIDGCVEPFDAKTEVFESALVIEATITDEFKKQEVLLNRAFRLEESGLNIEAVQNAEVMINDDTQNEYLFQESTAGKYISITEFGAQPNTIYQLHILTSDGIKYTSKPVTLPNPSPIYDVEAVQTINDENLESIGIFVQYDPAENTKFYRYEYEETYKIIAPKWTDVTLRFIGPFETILWPKEGSIGHVCFKTEVSDDIILNNVTGFSGGQKAQFPIRNINSDNYIISHRYSILVKQFVISRETHAYLETLKKFSGQEDLFSQTQPGFFSGNMYPEDDTDEKVLGNFDVTSLSIKRIFFDYSNFFPDKPLPPYVDDCSIIVSDPAGVRILQANQDVIYYNSNIYGKHLFVNRVCGDCTVLGNSEVPDFWME